MIDIVVCWSAAPRQVGEQRLQLAEGTTLRQAAAASAVGEQWPGWALEAGPGIWGRAVPWETPLHPGDRVELCRPLLVDPKVARRERFQRQGSRTAGLFAKRRQGAKAGY